MRKIHHGFIAIAVLLGPATLILGHEKLTVTPAQEVFESFDPPQNLRQAFTRCAEAPKQERSAQCDEYVSFFEQCANRRNECGPRMVYEFMTKLIISAAPKNQKPKSYLLLTSNPNSDGSSFSFDLYDIN
jgi:hypothetical protein